MRRHALVLAILSALGAAAAQADFRSEFKDGILAMDRRQWERAIAHFEQAIAENPESGGSVLIYGMRREPYLPHWQLGLARYRSGDSRGAGEAWQRELAQGVIQDDRAYSELEKLWPEVEALLAPVTPPPPEPSPAAAQLAQAVEQAESALERGARAEGSVREITGRSGFAAALETDPGLRRDLDQAAGRLRQARERLEQGRGAEDLAAVRAATTLAEEARQAYVGLLPRARQGLEAVELAERQARERRAEEGRQAEERRAEAERHEAAQALRGDLALLQGRGRDLLQRSTRLEGPSPGLTRDRRQLESLLGRIRSAGDDPEALRTLRGEIQGRLGPFEAALAEALAAQDAAAAEQARQAEARGGPPADLVNAARAYFSADYARALELLGTVEGFETRAQVQAHLFRAASAFTLYHLTQAPESDLLERVRLEIRALLALDPAFRPDHDLFSPRFVRFFEQAAG